MKKKDDEEEQHHKRGRGARKPLDVTLLNDSHVEFWAPGVGKGGEQAWKFACKCGERCSSYENYRYHPTGRQFQCTSCQIWSHTQCILGKDITDEEIEELEVIIRKQNNTILLFIHFLVHYFIIYHLTLQKRNSFNYSHPSFPPSSIRS